MLQCCPGRLARRLPESWAEECCRGHVRASFIGMAARVRDGGSGHAGSGLRIEAVPSPARGLGGLSAGRFGAPARLGRPVPGQRQGRACAVVCRIVTAPPACQGLQVRDGNRRPAGGAPRRCASPGAPAASAAIGDGGVVVTTCPVRAAPGHEHRGPGGAHGHAAGGEVVVRGAVVAAWPTTVCR